MLTAHARIEPLGWTVFVEQPISEAYQPLYAPLLRIGILLLLGLALSVLASLALARDMVRPINALREGAQAIGAGDLDHRIEVKTGDELQDLAEQFNRMADELRESYAGLERKVEERTAELRQALAFQQASGEILSSLSGSIADAKPVFDAIVRNLLRLFGTRFVVVQLLREGRIEIAALHGEAGFEKLAERYPRPLDGTTVGGHVMTSGKILQMTPVIGNPATPATTLEFARDFGFDSLLAAPMIREDKVVGAIVTAHRDAVPFDDKQVALIKAFADQAVIAIENVRLFHEIEDKSRQLEIANKHKSEFLANMSHELRTPLNAIIGFSEVLAERYFGELTAKQEEYVRDIHASGKHLLSLINDILDLSKIEAGRMDLELAEFDVPAALQNALTLVKERAQRHGVALKLDRRRQRPEHEARPRRAAGEGVRHARGRDRRGRRALGEGHRPDLVLMDIQLPGISGIEAFRQLRADPATARIPVAALTASVTPTDRT